MSENLSLVTELLTPGILYLLSVNCNTVDTFKKYVSIALESETDVNSWLC